MQYQQASVKYFDIASLTRSTAERHSCTLGAPSLSVIPENPVSLRAASDLLLFGGDICPQKCAGSRL